MNKIYNTFTIEENDGVMSVTINYPPINVLGIEMMKDLNELTRYLCNKNDIKVVIFESSLENYFIAHADIDCLQNLNDKKVEYQNIKVNDLAKVLDNLNKLPQVTIAKIDGYARGGGHELALACDLRYATKESIFMQMEVGMGILPCGGGSSRLAKIAGLGNALEIILGARDFNGLEAYKYGTINKVIEKEQLNNYVYQLAHRIAKFPSESIKACKKTIYASVNLTIDDCLKYETYQLYNATSTTPAIKRFKYASETNFQNNHYNQENFETKLLDLQKIK